MTEEQAKLQSKRHISGIWLVPAIAVVLGLWLLYEAYRNQGPTVEIHFATAEGIEIGKTRIRFRNVPLGKVSGITLDDALKGVWVKADMAPAAKPLLRENTHFWVVRPRIKGTSISGLGTIVSGAYIELDPGPGEAENKRRYRGLEEIPFTPAGTPGLRLQLISDVTGSLGAGDPVLYRGFDVGVVESSGLNVDTRQVSYSIFIHAPYDRLITANTRFWNASGFSAQLNSEGFMLHVGSLQSLIAGGVAFDLPANSEPGPPVAMNADYRLYPNRASIDQDPHVYFAHYVVSFTQSMRGLNPGATVTYRGIRIGHVVKIMMRESSAESGTGAGNPIPVLIHIEPASFGIADAPESVELLQHAMEAAVGNGLRATLESGSLLTGQLYIDLNYYSDQPADTMGQFQGYQEIPTLSGGLGQIQLQITRLLKKLNGLPLDATVASANGALGELRGTLAEMRGLLADEATRSLPGTLEDTLSELNSLLAGLGGPTGFADNLNRSLIELNRTLNALRGLSDQLEDKPNSLIFPVQREDDPVPRAGQP